MALPPREPPPEREPPPLSDREVEFVVGALGRWARSHPAPDRPVFGYAGTDLVSPRRLVGEVERRSELGEQYLDDVRRLTARVPLEAYLDTIERARAPWWRILLARIRNRMRPQRPYQG